MTFEKTFVSVMFWDYYFYQILPEQIASSEDLRIHQLFVFLRRYLSYNLNNFFNKHYNLNKIKCDIIISESKNWNFFFLMYKILYLIFQTIKGLNIYKFGTRYYLDPNKKTH